MALNLKLGVDFREQFDELLQLCNRLQKLCGDLNKRISQLETENQQLKDEIGRLQSERSGPMLWLHTNY